MNVFFLFYILDIETSIQYYHYLSWCGLIEIIIYYIDHITLLKIILTLAQLILKVFIKYRRYLLTISAMKRKTYLFLCLNFHSLFSVRYKYATYSLDTITDLTLNDLFTNIVKHFYMKALKIVITNVTRPNGYCRQYFYSYIKNMTT